MTTTAGASVEPGVPLRPAIGRPVTGLAATIDRWIYVFMAGLFMITVLVGFIPVSLDKIAAVEAGRRPPFPPVLHVHAVLMGSWIALLLTQAGLVATGRRTLHWKLGAVAFVLAPAIVLTALVLVPTMRGLQWDFLQATPAGPQRVILQGNFERAINVLLVQLRMGFVFAVLVTLALLARRRDAALHKRLLFLGTAILLPPAIDRIAFLPTTFPGSFVASDLYTLLLVSPMFAWDLYRLRKVHRAYLIWVGVLILPTLAVHLLWSTEWWQATGPRIVGLGG